MIIRNKCPLCNSDKRIFYEVYKRWPNLPIYKCRDCKFVYSEKVPSKDEIFIAQGEFNFVKDGIENKTIDSLNSSLLLSLLHKKLRYLQIIKKIKRILCKLNKTTQRVLDVGCSVGGFLDLIKKEFNVETYGVDIFPKICEFNKLRGHKILCGFLEELKFDGIKFDIITFLEVLEHLPDPTAAVKTAYNLLNNKGLLVIEVPNLIYSTFKGKIEKNFIFKKLTKMEEWGLMPHIHYNHFSPEVLKSLLIKHGFKCIEIIPALYNESVEGCPRIIKIVYEKYTILCQYIHHITGMILSPNFILFATKL